jgi:predicted GNAT family acetyltransferase
VRILHDPATHRFVIHAPEGDGELLYSLRQPGVMDFYHIGVDERVRNRGMGSALVGAAFQYAREHGNKVVPSSVYVRFWLERHPEARDTLFPM